MGKIAPTNSLEDQACVQEVCSFLIWLLLSMVSLRFHFRRLLLCSLGQCRLLPCQPSRGQQQYRLLVDLLRLHAAHRHHPLARLEEHLVYHLRRWSVLLHPHPLSFLAEQSLHATFFAVGSRCFEFPSILQNEHLQGHQIYVESSELNDVDEWGGYFRAWVVDEDF
jgi:hypothetical protein